MSYFKLSERKRRVNDIEASASCLFSLMGVLPLAKHPFAFLSVDVCFVLPFFYLTLYSVYVPLMGGKE